MFSSHLHIFTPLLHPFSSHHTCTPLLNIIPSHYLFTPPYHLSIPSHLPIFTASYLHTFLSSYIHTFTPYLHTPSSHLFLTPYLHTDCSCLLFTLPYLLFTPSVHTSVAHFLCRAARHIHALCGCRRAACLRLWLRRVAWLRLRAALLTSGAADGKYSLWDYAKLARVGTPASCIAHAARACPCSLYCTGTLVL